MNLQEFKLPPTNNSETKLMDQIISTIESKLRIISTTPKFISTDLELQKVLENHERLKKATISDLQDLQAEFERKLKAAKSQHEKDLAFSERLFTEKLEQIRASEASDRAETLQAYKDEIQDLQKKLGDQVVGQKKRQKFQKMKTFFFRQIREAKKKVHYLNLERSQMKSQILTLKRDLLEARQKLIFAQNGQQRSGGDFKHFTKVEIQFFSNKSDKQDLISRSDEIKRKLDTLEDAGYTDNIITELVNEYSRIEMVLNHFKQYNDRGKFLKK